MFGEWVKNDHVFYTRSLYVKFLNIIEDQENNYLVKKRSKYKHETMFAFHQFAGFVILI